MNKKLMVLNEDKNDCAAASLSSIIKYYGGNISMENIKEIINTTKHGTNAYDIIKGAKEIGFNAYGQKVALENIHKYKNKFPLIAHVKNGNAYHFVVIYKIDTNRNTILYMDPCIGFIKTKISDFQKKYLGTLLFFEKIKELPKESNSNKIFKEILVKILKDKKNLLLLFITSLITFLFSIISTYYYKIILEKPNVNRKYIISLLILFSLFIIIKNIFNYFRNKLIINTNYNIELFINNEVLSKLFNLPYAYYKNKTSGEIISRLNDLDNLRDILSDIILNMSINILIIIISFIIMITINLKLALITLIIVFLYYFFIKLYRNLFDRKIRIIQEEKGFYNNKLYEIIEGVETIKNLNIKSLKLLEINKTHKTYCDSNRSLNYSLNSQQFFKDFINDIGLLLLMTLGIIFVTNKVIKISDLILLYMINSYFLETVKSILNKDIELNYNLKNLEKINTIFSSKESKQTNETISGDIIIKKLQYSYSDKLILNNINFKIKSGDKFLLKGKSGSGKSTLIKILLKYLKDYNGKVVINGADYSKIEDNIINNSFTYIGQNEKIFSDTFKNNIILNRNIDESKYNKIIDICNLSHFKDKENILIEENGFNISGGEKQRIILARALLKNSNYIIIDEALSEVDTEIEKDIIKNLCEYFKEKTIIYVSHKKEIQDIFNCYYDIERRKIYEKR